MKNATELSPWKTLSSEEIADCRVFKVHKNKSTKIYGGHNNEHDFFVFHSGDWVNIIPITDNKEIILIEQYRHGTESFTLESPGGSVDDSDDDPLIAGIRELKEETGAIAREWTRLGMSHPNPAIQGNLCHTYLATGVEIVEKPQFDATEEIAIRKLPLEEVPRLIKTGVITHALVLVAFYWLQLEYGDLCKVENLK